MNTLHRLALSAGFVLALAGPALAEDYVQPANWDDVVAAAKKEGVVAVYGSPLGAKYYKEMTDNFTRQYGIEVRTIDGRSSELTERVQSEQGAGKFVGDVYMPAMGTGTLQSQAGRIQPIGAIPNAAHLRPDLPGDKYWLPCYVQGIGILYNTDMVKPADAPKSYHDLLDPKWKGKIIMDDARGLGAAAMMFSATEKGFGHDFNLKLAAQEPVLDRDLINSSQRVAHGEFPIYATEIFAFSVNLRGLPVQVVVPSEGASYAELICSVLKNAPHPNAARLFVNHFLADELQMLYGNADMTPVVQGVGAKANADVRDMANAKLLGTVTPDSQDAMTALAKQTFK